MAEKIGKSFGMTVGAFPCGERGFLPAGDNAIVMTATQRAQQEAAWDFMRFVTSPEGQSLMVTSTGYIPPKSRSKDLPVSLRDFLNTHPHHKFAFSEVDKARSLGAVSGRKFYQGEFRTGPVSSSSHHSEANAKRSTRRYCRENIGPSTKALMKPRGDRLIPKDGYCR
ncbi:extracellular solute-binding protein [Bradyrhizobium sp. SRL28]|uniref:extracellular solute-binding protein n=1 Tax=Bradyrhizobium sp. SRL28 TaxID=2836178 RepID=UPI001BDEB79F|nr:extracellular solute-binding protein [Bradyrhizobium sp. SRL28]MBT1517256.1 extracellular solute-binding protein [Bradyrhizobium sp. SRL28]